MQGAASAGGAAVAADADKFLSELGWREFSYTLLHHFPALATDNFRAQFDAMPWRDDPAALRAWQRGLTGYPLVDAGLRELWTTGWMHNRVRMVVASFLIKHLLIDWRAGEAWFWDTLVDADPANNAASWQWVAGCGADAAPYFRIFNPVAQGRSSIRAARTCGAGCPSLPASTTHRSTRRGSVAAGTRRGRRAARRRLPGAARRACPRVPVRSMRWRRCRSAADRTCRILPHQLQSATCSSSAYATPELK